mgnify:CR=1 FL=1
MEPFGVSFFHIFLHAKKDMAPGGPTEKRMPVKTQNKTIAPPEVASKAARQVKTQNKTIAPPEVVGFVERLVKNVQRKMEPPEGVSKRECR